MAKVFAVALLAFVGFAGWRIGGTLSSDAVGLALGLLLGIMAGIPAALMVLANNRQGESYRPPPRPRCPEKQIEQKTWFVVEANSNKNLGARDD